METKASKRFDSEQNDEISFRDLMLKILEWFKFLRSKAKIILAAGVLGGVLGLAFAYFKRPRYIATCTFVLEEAGSEKGLGRYAGLAAMAGVNIGGLSSESGVFQGDNILELYKSRNMLQKTLLSYGEFDGKQELLINRYITINKLRDSWIKKRELKHLSFDIPQSRFTRYHDSIMTDIIKDINKFYLAVTKPDKKTSIIEVDVSSRDEQFSCNFVNQVVNTVNSFYVETKTKKANENLSLLQHQADSVRSVLNESIGGTAVAIDANPNANPALQILRVPSQRKQVDVQANSAIYAEVVKNLELAKMSAMQEAPLIQIIDGPVYPLKKEQVSKIKGVFIGFFGAVFFAIFYLSFSRAIRNS